MQRHQVEPAVRLVLGPHHVHLASLKRVEQALVADVAQAVQGEPGPACTVQHRAELADPVSRQT